MTMIANAFSAPKLFFQHDDFSHDDYFDAADEADTQLAPIRHSGLASRSRRALRARASPASSHISVTLRRLRHRRLP